MATIEILKWQEGKNLQWLSREQVFDAIQKIDHAVFHENGLATKESDIARYEAFKDSYMFAVSENEIVGYVCYFPITKDFYQLVIKGEDVYDGNIAPVKISLPVQLLEQREQVLAPVVVPPLALLQV